jgi:heat shock protein HslJ
MRTRGIAALAALVLVMAACSPGPESGGQLDGTDWVLRSYDLDGTLTLVPDNLYADAEFSSNRVRGFAGCNTFEALYRAGGRTLFVSQPAVTLKACDDEAMALEQAFLAALDSSRFYTSRRQTLTIYGPGHTELLVFDAAPRNPLLGEWQVTAFNNGADAVTSPLAGTDIDVTFGIGSVGGFAGCNSFSGTYGTNANLVRIGALATTRIACEQEVMDQETAFLAALQGVALVETRGPQVNLTDLRGAIKVTLVRPKPPAVALPEPSGEPTEEPTEEPTAEPTETAQPTEEPSPTPTPTPAATPSPPPSAPSTEGPLPSFAPPVDPNVATCDLATEDGTIVATIVYPGDWFTLSEPASAACRFFDPNEIDIPAGGEAPITAVMATVEASPYGEAVAAATDPASWDVRETTELVVDGLPTTLVEGTATGADPSFPAGRSRFAYLIDLGSAGSLMLFTTAETVDDAYASRAGVVTLMMAASVFASVD